MIRGQYTMLSLIGTAAIIGLGLFGGTPEEQPATRPQGKLEEQVRETQERLERLEHEVKNLNRKLTSVVSSFEQRFRRLENKDLQGKEPRLRQPSGPSSRNKELSPRIKRLYEQEKPRRSGQIKGISYDVLQSSLRNSTKDGKEKLAEAVKGTPVNWSGWVQAVRTTGDKSRVKVNMRGDPETFPSAVVTLTVPARVAKSLEEGKKIQFVGQIKSIDLQFYRITLKNASVRL